MEEQLREVAELSGVFEIDDDYLSTDTRERFNQIVPNPGKLRNEQWVDAYLHLKQNVM